MINLEVFRLELNYLKQVVKGIIGDKASSKLCEAIEMLILYFLNPTNCDSLSLTYIQAIDKYLNQIQHEIASYEYKLLLNNIPTIIIFIERVKSEIPKC